MPRIGESATVSPPWCSPNSDRVTVGTFANFRIAIDNEFRGEFSYVQYRRWGLLQVWEGGRPYDGRNVLDLVRAVRNVFEHWFDRGPQHAEAERLSAVAALTSWGDGEMQRLGATAVRCS